MKKVRNYKELKPIIDKIELKLRLSIIKGIDKLDSSLKLEK